MANNKKSKTLSFADLAKKIDKKYSKASPYDQIASASKQEELDKLRMQQEAIKAQYNLSNTTQQFASGGALSGGIQGLSTGAQIGTMIMPGWGTAIGGGLGLIGGAIMGSKAEDKEEKIRKEQLALQQKQMELQVKAMRPVTQYNYGMSNIPVVGYAYGGSLNNYVGTTHDKNPDGGIPVDKQGNPVKVTKNPPVGTVEGGETAVNGYIFSNKLGPDGVTMSTIKKETPMGYIDRVPYKTIEQLPYTTMNEKIKGTPKASIGKTENVANYSVSPNFKAITPETFRQHNKRNQIFSDEELADLYKKDPKEAAIIANNKIKESYKTLNEDYIPYKFETKDGKLGILNNRAIVKFNKTEYNTKNEKKDKSIGDTYELYDYDKSIKDQLGDIQKRFAINELPKMQFGGIPGQNPMILGSEATYGLGDFGMAQSDIGSLSTGNAGLGNISELSSILGGQGQQGGFMQGLGNAGSFLNKNTDLISGLSGLASEIAVNRRDIKNAIPAPVNYQRVTPYLANFSNERQDIGKTFDLATEQARKNAINTSRTRGELMTNMAAANVGIARQKGQALGQSYQSEQIANINALSQANRSNSMIQMQESIARQQEADAAESKKSQAYHNISQSYQGFLKDQSTQRAQNETMKYLGFDSPSVTQIEIGGSSYPAINVGNGLQYSIVNGEKMYFYNNQPISQEEYKQMLIGG